MKQPTQEFEGLVGFFDLLGYKNICRNNDIFGCSGVIDILEKSVKKAQAKNTLPSTLGCPKVEVVAFADSILIYPESPDQISDLWFGLVSGSLLTELLLNGLPARGAISRGKFLIKRSKHGLYLGGSAIIEARDLADSLDFAGCAVASSAQLEVQTWDKRVWIEYNAQFNNNTTRSITLLDTGEFWSGRELSLKLIEDSFRAHNKSIDCDRIRTKIANTCALLETCKNKHRL